MPGDRTPRLAAFSSRQAPAGAWPGTLPRGATPGRRPVPAGTLAGMSRLPNANIQDGATLAACVPATAEAALTCGDGFPAAGSRGVSRVWSPSISTPRYSAAPGPSSRECPAAAQLECGRIARSRRGRRGRTGDLRPGRPGPTPAEPPRGSANVKVAQGKGNPEGNRGEPEPGNGRRERTGQRRTKGNQRKADEGEEPGGQTGNRRKARRGNRRT